MMAMGRDYAREYMRAYRERNRERYNSYQREYQRRYRMDTEKIEEAIEREIEFSKKALDKSDRVRWRWGFVDGLEYALKIIKEEKHGAQG